MAKKFHERRSLAAALLTYLQGRNWNISEVKEGFQSGDTIQAPTVSVYFLPSAFEQLEMGGSKTHKRRVQVDAYMENESTADGIGDDIMDFLDEVPILVQDVTTDADLANMLSDTSTITNETVPPILKEAKFKHWRNVSRATYEVLYF